MSAFDEPTISEMRTALRAAGFNLQEYILEGFPCPSWENLSASFPVSGNEAQSVKLAYAYLKEQEQLGKMQERINALTRALMEVVEIATYLSFPANLIENDYVKERENIERVQRDTLAEESLKLIEWEMKQRGEE
jgi:hypothetical protein